MSLSNAVWWQLAGQCFSMALAGTLLGVDGRRGASLTVGVWIVVWIVFRYFGIADEPRKAQKPAKGEDR